MITLSGSCGYPVYINERHIVSVTCKNINNEKTTFVRTVRGDFFVSESAEEVLNLITNAKWAICEKREINKSSNDIEYGVYGEDF